LQARNREVEEALAKLYRRHAFGIKLGLDVETALLEALGNPQDDYAVVHVAGTNGKGSVCALLDSVLRARGLRVGLYTSPHLVRFNERIRVDGRSIDDASLLDRIRETERAAEAVAARLGREPTFFEAGTAMALDHFRRSRVQMAVLETGMGGRLDATNVPTPLLCVLTRIAVDHTQYLGTDLRAIAAEKCGIIKEGVPVVRGAMDEEAAEVVARTARERKAPLADSGRTSVCRTATDLRGQRVVVETEERSYGALRLPLLGDHQLENLAVTVTALEMLGGILGVEFGPDCLRAGVESVRWPGRFQILSEEPLMILDGGHNPDAARALVKALARTLGRRPLGLVTGMCEDKDRRGFLAAFGGRVKRVWTVPIESDRGASAADLLDMAKSMGWEGTTATVAAALRESEEWARQCGGGVCIAGSLFLAGQVLRERGEEF
jgi:dihydrofolate synthase/folylpolyglutamate synthase